MPAAFLPPAWAMLGRPPPRPSTRPAICLITLPAWKPAFTASSEPAASRAGVPFSVTLATTQATGPARRPHTQAPAPSPSDLVAENAEELARSEAVETYRRQIDLLGRRLQTNPRAFRDMFISDGMGAIAAEFRQPEKEGGRRIRFAEWTLDTLSQHLTHENGSKLDLTGSDFILLSLFLQNPGQALDRDSISDATRGRETLPMERGIDVQISRLRQKLGDNGKNPRIIKTIRGSGYMLIAEVSYED